MVDEMKIRAAALHDAGAAIEDSMEASARAAAAMDGAVAVATASVADLDALCQQAQKSLTNDDVRAEVVSWLKKARAQAEEKRLQAVRQREQSKGRAAALSEAVSKILAMKRACEIQVADAEIKKKDVKRPAPPIKSQRKKT